MVLVWGKQGKNAWGKKNTVWHWGVRLYISSDLYNWEDKGLIIPPQPEDLSSPLHPTYCMDRPHIIYNKKTGKYVAWLKIMAGEVSQFMSVLTADRFEGPYTFARKIYKPLDMDTGDFCLHVDKKSGKAYIWFERPHFQLICEGDKTGTSFSAQFTSVIRVPGTKKYIACADRWMPQWYVKPMAKLIIYGMKRHFADYRPDTSPQEATPLPGKEIHHSENTSVSRYVWLPIGWKGEKPVIRWRKEWSFR